jgi:hypothetical protein
MNNNNTLNSIILSTSNQFNIMKKLILSTIFSLATIALFAQVKIGANPTLITTNAKLQVEGSTGNKVTVMDNGNVGIGTATPNEKLEVAGNTKSTNLQVTGLTTAGATDQFVTVDATGVCHKAAAAKPQNITVKVPTGATLTRGGAGSSFHYAANTVMVNTIDGATVAANGDITVPAGTYQVAVTFDGSVISDATPPAGFYIHSYFYDFSTTSSFVRVHSNTTSVLGGASSHGVSIIYTTVVNAGAVFPFNIGFGQGGNANGTTTLVFGSGCQLSVTKLQ